MTEKQNPHRGNRAGCLNHFGGEDSSPSKNQWNRQAETRVAGTLAIQRTTAIEAIIWRYFSAGTVTHG
ncbi:hypothetical protein [Parasphingorhabdus sp.]|uniref:hypothetical protein n=1 Tax=Parasphingorhabdus sp. TaxID=2709688 RepID=UPI00300184D7